MDDDLVEAEAPSTPRPLDGPAVLQVLPELNEGGVERGTSEVARFLVAEGWRAHVAAAGGTNEERLREIGVEVHRLPLASKNPLLIRKNIAALERIIREQRIDLVHARSRAPAWSAHYAARRARVPFVTTFHGIYSGSERWLKRRYNGVMAKGDRVIAISDFVAEHLKTVYGVGPDRLRIVRRGVDLDAFDPARVDLTTSRELYRAWGIPDDVRIVMLPGRVARRKGHRYLIEALTRLPNDDVVCLFVGGFAATSGYVQELERLIADKSLDGRVRFVGATDRMPEALSLADVVVVPSVDPPEAFGRVSVEAQAMGRPVIVSDNGGLGETLMPAATGWLVPAGDAAALAEALDLALAMPADSRDRLARRARDFVAQSYSLAQMTRRTLAVYRELLEARSERTSKPRATNA